MTKTGRPSEAEQLLEAEAIPPERYPELIRLVRERDPAAYFAMIAAALEEEE